MDSILVPSVKDLPRLEDRLSFIYVEHATISRDKGSLTITDDTGVAYLPVASLNVLLLGPGTRVTHQAVSLAGESSCSIVWVGEQGVRFYAGSVPLDTKGRFISAQAKLVSNPSSRLAVAKKMYAYRFPDDDVESMNLRQLRGKEGSRMREVYANEAKVNGIAWSRRRYQRNDFQSSDDINKALSVASSCLYGVCQAATTSLGLSPALGFIHTGSARSFVFDVADLYKTRISIPVAFETVKDERQGLLEEKSLSSEVRYRMRDAFNREKILKTIVNDLTDLLELKGVVV